MEMLKTVKITQDNLPLRDNTACSIGNFDGFHLGHQKILNKLIEEAKKRNLKTVVVTFDPHPKKILSGENVCTITNLETKLAFLSKLEIDYLLIIRFDENFYRMKPDEFLNFLSEMLSCKLIVVGEDWRFGYRKQGDIEFAKKYGDILGVEVIPVKSEKINGKKISSSTIRKLLKEGKVEEISVFLGRKYCIFGKVVKGHGKGKLMGFPTINVKLPPDMCLKRGVYAGYVIINHNSYRAAINYGKRPTIDGKDEFLEIHVIDRDKLNIDTEYIKVIFESFIREEKKFQNIDALKSQISLDIKKIKEVLNKNEVV